jgi:hypothetical protein
LSLDRQLSFVEAKVDESCPQQLDRRPSEEIFDGRGDPLDHSVDIRSIHRVKWHAAEKFRSDRLLLSMLAPLSIITDHSDSPEFVSDAHDAEVDVNRYLGTIFAKEHWGQDSSHLTVAWIFGEPTSLPNVALSSSGGDQKPNLTTEQLVSAEAREEFDRSRYKTDDAIGISDNDRVRKRAQQGFSGKTDSILG